MTKARQGLQEARAFVWIARKSRLKTENEFSSSGGKLRGFEARFGGEELPGASCALSLAAQFGLQVDSGIRIRVRNI